MKSFAARSCTAAIGGVLIAGVALAAVADPKQIGDDEGVDVKVSIAEVEEPGVLAMTVADDEVSLAETDSAVPSLRQFEGTLPAVTVSDTRTEDQIGDGTYWYVVGQASAFSGAGTIPAANLGWTPFLTTDDPDVVAGEEVAPVTDTAQEPDNVGLVDKELLAISIDAAQTMGSWTAKADLLLKTPVDQAPGSYSSVLTLSLWEDVA